MSDIAGRAVIEVVSDASKFKAGVDEAKRSVKSLGNELGSAVADGTAKATRSLDAYIKKIEVSAATIGMSARETKLLELAQRGATAEQLKAADAALGTIESYKQQQAEARKASAAAATGAAIAAAAQATQGKATKLTANEARQLSFQLNDLFVQIASGQSPITALIQQGSQLNGTFGSIGGTLRAVGTIFTATRVVIGGIAGVFAGIGYAAYEGMQQSKEFAKSLLLTGNAAGVTEGQFNELAKTIAEATKTSVGSARDSLQGLVSSGRFSGDALGATATATQLLARVTGQSTEDIVKQFVGMSDGVAKWADTTNKSYHFITAEQLRYVKTLEEQGSQQKAIEVVMGALNARLGEVTKNVGFLERAWGGVSRAAKSALDTMLSIGRTNTVDDQIEQLQKKIEFTNKSAGGLTGMSATALAAFNKGAEAQLAALKATKGAQEDVAKGQERAIAQETARVKFDELREQSLSKQQKMTKELAAANALADKAGVSQAEREKVLANIRDKYKEAKGPKDPDLRKGELGVDIAKIKAEAAARLNIYQGSESILEATRSAGLLSEKEYYEAKRGFLDLTMQAQVAELEQENKLLENTKVGSVAALENQKKLAENQGKINQIKTDAAVKGQILDIQQKASMDSVKRSYEEARIAAQDYLNTLTLQQNRDLSAYGMGDKERNRQAGRQQIEDRYTQQKLDIENNKRLLEMDGKFTQQSREQYETRLGIVNEFQEKALVGWDDYYSRLIAKEGDWTNGASRAMQNYLDSAANVSQQTEGLFTEAFHGLEDVFVNFVTTGKLSFGDFARSILADIARIQAKNLISSLMGDKGGSSLGLIAKLFGSSGIGSNSAGEAASLAALGGNTIGGFADGGRPPMNVPSMVGERGPELFIPDGAGTIIPNHMLGGGGATVTYAPTIQIDSRTDRQAVMADVQKAVRQGNAELVDQLSRAGKI